MLAIVRSGIVIVADIAAVAMIGLVAGVIGGLAGIGGSLIMIPGLALVLGYDDESHSRHHVFMAAAMVVNVLVSAPAGIRHARAGAVRMDLLRVILPVMLMSIVVGVLVSNRLSGERLKILLALFISVYCVYNLVKAALRHGDPDVSLERRGWPVLGSIGGVTGFLAGLVGIGGGIVMVPALQMISGVRLRHAIGTSSAIMAISAVLGASMKVGTLESVGRSWTEALMLAGVMGPLAFLGGWVGARLTHALPLQGVRVVISILLLAAAARLAGFL